MTESQGEILTGVWNIGSATDFGGFQSLSELSFSYAPWFGLGSWGPLSSVGRELPEGAHSDPGLGPELCWWPHFLQPRILRASSFPFHSPVPACVFAFPLVQRRKDSSVIRANRGGGGSAASVARPTEGGQGVQNRQQQLVKGSRRVGGDGRRTVEVPIFLPRMKHLSICLEWSSRALTDPASTGSYLCQRCHNTAGP